MRKFYALGMILSCCVLSCAANAVQKRPMVHRETALELSSYSAEQIEPLLPLLEEWVQREFIQYPYLWLPPKGEFCMSNVMLAAEKEALVTIVRKGQQVVGVAAAVSFDSEAFRTTYEAAVLGSNQSILEKMKEQGFDPSKMLYMNYFLTAPEYRNDENLVGLIYNNYVDFAHKIGRTQLCYFEDAGRVDHPLKPAHPTPIEPWGHAIQGFKSMYMQADLSWPTVQLDGSARDEAHTVEFFFKDI